MYYCAHADFIFSSAESRLESGFGPCTYRCYLHCVLTPCVIRNQDLKDLLHSQAFFASIIGKHVERLTEEFSIAFDTLFWNSRFIAIIVPRKGGSFV